MDKMRRYYTGRLVELSCLVGGFEKADGERNLINF